MKRELAIIGPGRVGTAIGVLARQSGYRVKAVGGRDRRATRRAATRIGPEVAAVSVKEAPAGSALVLLTVADDGIAPVATELAAMGALRGVKVLAHCSGALSGEVLAVAREAAGCAVGSAHPLQTFPNVEAALTRLPGASWVCEGDTAACAVLAELGARMGLRPLRIASADKAGYHAMGVMASNYLVALMDAALTLGERAGMDRGVAWEALAPLVEATLANIGELGTAAALTGPIQRGDAQTVRRHLEYLAAEPALDSLYRRLGAWTCVLAREEGMLDRDTAERLLQGLGLAEGGAAVG